jgi:signal transduction histidine kinase
MGDSDALKQLLLILVENGVKYTAEGSVTISLLRDGGRVLLQVRDTGSGIENEDLPHIFERFYRSASSRASGGTGLGLPIAKWIAEEHGGNMSVETEVGQGSCFTVRLVALPAVPGEREADIAAGAERSSVRAANVPPLAS